MPDMPEIRFLCGSGGLGAGKNDPAIFEEAMKLKPHFIACDAGTTDAGPFALGSGRSNYPREGVKRDLGIVLAAARRAGIPVVVGSCGTAGLDKHVDWFVDIANEIATEHQFKLRTAVVHSEQSKEYLKGLLRDSRIRALNPAPELDEGVIERSEHVVGMMGVEPLQAAFGDGVDLIIAGRSSDSALYAAIPILKGFPEGLAWHAGKVMECGTQACVHAGRGFIGATMTQDSFTVRCFGKGLHVTPQSIAAHSFYENGDPYLHTESSGTLDITNAVYEQTDDGGVRVSKSAFIHSDTYTVKLEGAELVGYQSVVIGGLRDPFFIRQLDTWLENVRKKTVMTVEEIFGLKDSEFHIDFHVYGRNALMGPMEPVKTPAHEVGIVMEVTAKTQDIATKIAELARQPLLHTPIPEWSGSITSFACLHNPPSLDRGPVYRFAYNHVAIPRSKTEMFRHSFKELG